MVPVLVVGSGPGNKSPIGSELLNCRPSEGLM